MSNFYIYIYLDPRKPGYYCYNNTCFLFEPVYIGKGKNGRYRNLNENRRNRYFIRKINKIKQSILEPIVFKLYENLNEQQSFELEIKLIKEIGRIDLRGPLVNMTDGGEGISGLVFSNEHKRRISESNKGKILSEERKKKISEKEKGKICSEESKKKMSESRKGKNNPMFGVLRSEETRI